MLAFLLDLAATAFRLWSALVVINLLVLVWLGPAPSVAVAKLKALLDNTLLLACGTVGVVAGLAHLLAH